MYFGNHPSKFVLSGIDRISSSNLSSRTIPTSGEQTPTAADFPVGPSTVYRKPSLSDTSSSSMTPLLLCHRSSDGDKATSRFTATEIVVPNLIDKNLDKIFPWRETEG